MKPPLICKQKPALMLASLPVSFPFQPWFINSNISIKHLVSNDYGAQFSTGCLLLRIIKEKSMWLAHVEAACTGGQTVPWDLKLEFLALAYCVTHFLTCLSLSSLLLLGD